MFPDFSQAFDATSAWTVALAAGFAAIAIGYLWLRRGVLDHEIILGMALTLLPMGIAAGYLTEEPIPAYFIMLVTGFAICIALGVVWAKRSALDPEVIIDLGLVSLIAGVAGARILHVFVDGYFWDYVHLCTDPSQVAWQITHSECVRLEGAWDSAAQVCHPTSGDCFAWAKFWQGGLVWYGGLIGAGGYGIHFLRKEGFPVLKGLDMTGMMLPLGVFFGRIGCFFGGCCFGVHSDHFTALSFPAWSPASEAQYRAQELASPALASLPVLPTQLFEAIGCLAIAAFCAFGLHPRKRYDGQVFGWSMVLYAVVRFFLEYLRADDRGAFIGISTSQWIGLAFVLVFLVLLARWKRAAALRA